MVRLLVGFFFRSLIFFGLILFFPILQCSCLQNYWWQQLPFHAVSFSFCPLLFFLYALMYICCVLRYLFCLLVLFCCFFSLFFILFSLFFVFVHFFNTCKFVCFCPFLVVSCSFFFWVVWTCNVGCLETLCASTTPLHSLWWSCGDHTILVAISPPDMILPNMSCSTINHFFCLVLRLPSAHASPCTHPNSYPPSWVPPYPFSVCPLIYVFFGKFPGHACSENIHCWPIHASFCLVSLCISAIAPNHTHLNPSARIFNLPHSSAPYITLKIPCAYITPYPWAYHACANISCYSTQNVCLTRF